MADNHMNFDRSMFNHAANDKSPEKQKQDSFIDLNWQ